MQIADRNLHASGVPSKIPPISHKPLRIPIPPLRFIRLCKLAGIIALPRKGDLVLRAFLDSVKSSSKRAATREAALIGRSLSRESAIKMAMTSRGARPYAKWWGGERDGRLSYIVTQSRWRAQSTGVRKHARYRVSD